MLTAAAVVAALFAVVGTLYVFQERLIYFPRKYADGAMPSDAPGAEPRPLRYRSEEHAQCSYLVPPRSGAASRLWIVFGGNGSLAREWTGFASRFPDATAAFLLFEYPGYGDCAGRPSPDAIAQAAERALEALHGEPGIAVPPVRRPAGVLGHSLGAAAALRFAVAHPVDRVVLVAPFTSLRDMARLRIFPPLHLLLRHEYDNRARLDELARRAPRPRVTIVHGTDDAVIPVRMGRELAARHPEMTRWIEIPGATHNRILDEHERTLFEAMVDDNAGAD